jgi:glycosyltransferase involved in cell wall biosynthesis
MHILAASDFDADSDRAHAINVVKTAGGFSRLGHRVTLLCRAPGHGLDTDALARRYAEPGIEWIGAEPLDDEQREKDHEGVGQAFGNWVAEQADRFRPDAVYARHFHAAIACADYLYPTAIETHAYIGDERPILNQTFAATARSDRALRALITISHRLADHYVARGAAESRVHVVPDGVDLDLFARPADPGPTPYTSAGRNVTYAGHLYDHKGIPTILVAAKLLPDVRFHLIGGTAEDIHRVMYRVDELGIGNVTLHASRPHADVPPWLWHASALLLPPSANEPSANWTSPVKLGEYLASLTPIIASDIPALRDWVDDHTVNWFRPDDPEDLARAVGVAVRETPEQRAERCTHASDLSLSFSYERRARTILDAIHA